MAQLIAQVLASCNREEAKAKALTVTAPGTRVRQATLVEASEGRPLPTAIRRNYPGPVWVVQVEIVGRISWVIVDDGSGKPVLAVDPRE